MRSIKKVVSGIVLMAFIGLGGPFSPVYPVEFLPPGSTLPAFKLTLPDSPEIKTYLGITGAKTFFLSQVPSKLLLIEFFDIFCLVCQKGTPTLNQLFRIIQGDQDLAKNIKMIGIALGSDPRDLAIYRQKFKVEFPLFADPQQEIRAGTKIKFVPLIVLVDRNGKTLLSHAGPIGNVDRFLVDIRKHAKAP